MTDSRRSRCVDRRIWFSAMPERCSSSVWAVDGQVVCGSLCRRLSAGGFRLQGLLDRRGRPALPRGRPPRIGASGGFPPATRGSVRDGSGLPATPDTWMRTSGWCGSRRRHRAWPRQHPVLPAAQEMLLSVTSTSGRSIAHAPIDPPAPQPAPGDRRRDLRQRLLRGLQQLRALAAPLLAQPEDRPLAGSPGGCAPASGQRRRAAR